MACHHASIGILTDADADLMFSSVAIFHLFSDKWRLSPCFMYGMIYLPSLFPLHFVVLHFVLHQFLHLSRIENVQKNRSIFFFVLDQMNQTTGGGVTLQSNDTYVCTNPKVGLVLLTELHLSIYLHNDFRLNQIGDAQNYKWEVSGGFWYQE